MSRSLNKATLIGNLTRDPELRYTPQGTAVCTFSIATNRQWKTESGELRDEAEFHRIVAWDKLAEICSQMLSKGKRVYVEGRIQTRKWTDQDNQPRTTTEIVISDMLLLDRGRDSVAETEVEVPSEDLEEISGEDISVSVTTPPAEPVEEKKKSAKKTKESPTETTKKTDSEEEIPF